MLMWRNWYTHSTQNAAGNHVGSSPTISTTHKRHTNIEKQYFVCFYFRKIGEFDGI